MGLFDSIACSVLGKFGGEQGGIAQVAMDLFNEHGGLNGILEKFKEGGLGETAASWVGTGENAGISAEQIASILGTGTIATLAAKVGITPETLSAQIAEHLPNLVDKLTPNGEVPAESGSLLSNVFAMLK